MASIKLRVAYKSEWAEIAMSKKSWQWLFWSYFQLFRNARFKSPKTTGQCQARRNSSIIPSGNFWKKLLKLEIKKKSNKIVKTFLRFFFQCEKARNKLRVWRSYQFRRLDSNRIQAMSWVSRRAWLSKRQNFRHWSRQASAILHFILFFFFQKWAWIYTSSKLGSFFGSKL